MYGANIGTVTTGGLQSFAVDSVGRQVIMPYGSRTMALTKTLIMASNTSQQQLLAGTTGGPWNDIISIQISSTVGTSAIAQTTVYLATSSGQADPGVWSASIPIFVTPGGHPVYQQTFAMPLPASNTSTGGWFIVSSSSGAHTLRVNIMYVPTST